MPPKNRTSLRPPPMRRTATPLPGMNSTRSVLPAEIISTILDYLPIRDLMSFARVSHRLQEMAYDDSRWVGKLAAMGLWNEAEARARFDDAMRRRREREAARRAEEESRFAAKRASKASTVFDVVEEEKKAAAEAERRKTMAAEAEKRRTVDLVSGGAAPRAVIRDKAGLLTVLKGVRSQRGFARQEFGRIYGALAPLYFDVVKAQTHTDPEVFRIFRDPEEQAAMLSQLRVFSECDTAVGWYERSERLKAMMGLFENAALREFEGGYEADDIDGRMKRYAHVLISLNGGVACIQLFVQKHPVLYEKESLGNPLDCFDKPTAGEFSLEPSKEFFRKLGEILKEQAGIVDRVFPPTVNVMLPFLERVAEDVISDYTTPIVDEAHERDTEQYLKAVVGLYKQSLDFAASLAGAKGSGDTWRQDAVAVMVRVFDQHVDLYLQEELDYFRKTCEAEVDEWDKKIKEQDTAAESFFMSNVSNREADKRDFLSSFKKVILAPVSVIPSAFTSFPGVTAAPKAPLAAPTAHPHPEGSPYAVDNHRISVLSTATDDSLSLKRSSTLSVASSNPRASSPAPPPTTELAAKAAIMNSRLEGIRTLFSLEIALSLVQHAKRSLERAAHFARTGGQTGEEAREQCECIFTTLLTLLGTRHVKAGFDTAVEHLSAYNPREVATHSPDAGVAPLITFLELVSVGDLIQQMVDVFYEQELVAPRLTDRNDFLNPAAKEKKRFEQMLDERVAAGLNVGIDVLISEVEHVFATTQQPTDFNTALQLPGAPAPAPSASASDLGPSATATQIVALVSSHTSLLVGATDKTILEVFNQEVGLRLFTSITKHIKRQRISVDGAIRLIADVNTYAAYISTLKIKSLGPYYAALKELAQIYLIDPGHARQMAAVIADGERFGGIFRVEEVYEYAARREDWFRVRKEVERAMYGFGCCVM
ncbi:exocyst complex component Sec10-like protein [Geopyxis carbonaria]|nr:exocyst complex component Sec10-like protein [Geopyxis carbonaria]